MSIPLAKRVQERIESHGKTQQIEQLCLDGIVIFKLDFYTSELIMNCYQIQYLTMNDCHLDSLSDLPFLPHLIAFEAISNKIKDIDLSIISLQFPKLSALALDDNLIQTVDSFALLEEMEDLEHIEIQRNPICQLSNYRDKIFERLPNLRMIDCQDVFGDSEALFEDETDSSQSDDEVADIVQEDIMNDEQDDNQEMETQQLQGDESLSYPQNQNEGKQKYRQY